MEIDGAIIRANRKLPADGSGTEQDVQAPPSPMAGDTWGGGATNGAGAGDGSASARPVRPSPPPRLAMQEWRQQVKAGAEQAGAGDAEQAAAQRRLQDGAQEQPHKGLHAQQAQQAQQQGTQRTQRHAAQAHPQRYHRHVEPEKEYPPWTDKLPRPSGKPLPRPNCRDRQPAKDCQAWAARGECDSRPGELGATIEAASGAGAPPGGCVRV